jgi:insertion element IS1 protein InsB
MVKMLVNGNGIRDIANILGVSLNCVLRTLLKVGELIHIKPVDKRYHRVQIDELYSFVGHKQKKVWMLYAYCAETDEILAMTAGKRSAKQVKDLLKRLEDIQVDWWCTDAWSAFKEVFPYYQHLIGKRFTKAIEGVNNSLRNACKRLHRRTTSFSKRVRNHWFAIKMVVHQRNGNLSYN